jgi:putative tryptophan/tyrosine transport system substrate-binding protein
VIRRRDFIPLLGGAAAAWPLAARAQQPDRMRRIGVLMNAAATDAYGQSLLASFVDGLRQSGWVEGQNVRIDVRWVAGDAELARIYAAQLIGLQPDVILADTTNTLTVIRQATSTVPIVFVQTADPVAQGFVSSVRQPGGNLTGLSLLEFSLGGKWLDLLKKVAPALARAAVMFNPDIFVQSKFWMRAIEAAAPPIGVQAIALPVRAMADIEPALENLARQPNGGLILPSDGFTRLHLSLIADLAARYRLPSIGPDIEFVKQGCLMNYGPYASLPGQFRQAASYIDRILKGEKPGDLPVQSADRYTLGINLKTAKTLGLTIPPNVLAIADEVIE